MNAAMSGTAERRRHPRVATSLRMHCQRIGRDGVDDDVDVVDLSMAGVRISAVPELQVGDVVRLTTNEAGPLTLSGLVVHVSNGSPGGGYGHIAFTRLVPETKKQIADLIEAIPQT